MLARRWLPKYFKYVLSELPVQQFNAWVRPLQAIEREGQLRLLAPNRYVIDWLGDNALPRLRELVQALAEGLAARIAILVTDGALS